MVRVTDLAVLAKGSRVAFKDEEKLCERCQSPIASSRLLERIAHLLGPDYSSEMMGRLCTACRGL
jgi:hypothetical protein